MELRALGCSKVGLRVHISVDQVEYKAGCNNTHLFTPPSAISDSMDSHLLQLVSRRGEAVATSWLDRSKRALLFNFFSALLSINEVKTVLFRLRDFFSAKIDHAAFFNCFFFNFSVFRSVLHVTCFTGLLNES